MRPLAAVACVLHLAACSTAHMTDPGHSWFPLSAEAKAEAAKSGKAPSAYDAAGRAFVDALWLPFHALGHVFGQAPRDGSR